MASSFKGWGGSWAQTWDRVTNPNAMYGSATIRMSATGALTGVNIAPQEDPLWLPMFGSNIRKQKLELRKKRRKQDEELMLFGLV